MFFNSIEFAAFFAVVFTLYCALKHRWQNRMLLAASYIFYGWAEPKFLLTEAKRLLRLPGNGESVRAAGPAE